MTDANDDNNGTGTDSTNDTGTTGTTAALTVSLASNPAVTQVLDSCLNSLSSEHSRRAYRRVLSLFLSWSAAERRPLDKSAVLAYRRHLLETMQLSPDSCAQALAAIRKFALEAADLNYLDPHTAEAISRVRSPRTLGRRTGNWLDRDAAERLLNYDPGPSLTRIRNRAVVAVLLGTGIRREELCSVTWEQLQMREGRWLFADLLGKGQRHRTVPIPSWCYMLLSHYRDQIELILDAPVSPTAPIFPITPNGVYYIVRAACKAAKLTPVSPHDLRRTFSKLARQGGAPIEQVQFALGHSSVATTERYLGEEQDLSTAPCDQLQLKVKL